MKTRRSSSDPPLWSSSNKRSSSHQNSSSYRQHKLSSLIHWSLVLSVFCQVVPTLSHPHPFLFQRGNRYGYARNIRPQPCATKGGDTGVCMFAWDCMKANGTHLGTCIDRFYFGSCCKLDSKKIPVEFPDDLDNIIPEGPPGKPITVKPHTTMKPTFDLTPTSTTASGITDKTVTDMTDTDSAGSNMPASDNIGSNMTDPGNNGSNTGIDTTNVGETSFGNTGDGGNQLGMDNMTVVGGTVTENPKPVTVDIQVTENDQHGLKEDEDDKGSHDGVEIDAPAGESEDDTMELPGDIDGGGDNADPNGMMGENPNIGDSNIINAGVGNLGADEATNDPMDETTIYPFSETTNKPLIDNISPESPIVSSQLPAKEPATTIRPPSTDSPIDEEPMTTFPPIKVPNETDGNKDKESTAATVIPPTGGPTKPNDDKIENDESSGDPELTTLWPTVTEKPEDDLVDKTEPNIGSTDIEPLETTIKPDPAVNKPGIETVTSPSMPDDHTIINPGGFGSPLPGFPGDVGINVITIVPAAGRPGQTTEVIMTEPSTDMPDGLIIISTTTESEKPEDPVTNFPVESTTIESPKPVGPVTNVTIIHTTTESGKPVDPVANTTVVPTTAESQEPVDPVTNFTVESITTESPKPVDSITNTTVVPMTTESQKPVNPATNVTVVPTITESPVSVDPVVNTTVVPMTTESQTTVEPITNIPVVSTEPTIKPSKPVVPGTNDTTDWDPIVFPPTEKPKTTEKPIVISTDKIPPQVETQEPDQADDPEDPIVVAASTTTEAIIDTTPLSLAESLKGANYSEICGRPVYPTKRIVGGSDASFGEFPWQVSLRQWRSVTFLHKCGAALLNENWAVTAAHCVENVQPEQLLLRLGEFDLETADEPFGFVERKVQIIATHPQFDARTFEYDLALLRFYEPIDFQPNVIPICIPQDDYNFIGDTGYVSGWGRLYEDGPLPSIMQKVPVPVITNPECEAMYKVAGYVEHIPQIFICAGYEAGLKDSCEGDSGGPMVIQRDGVWNLAGVISWGIGCALPNQPGVYTRISAFREWIEKIIVF